MRNYILIICLIIGPFIPMMAQTGPNRYHAYGIENPLKVNVYVGPLAACSHVEGKISIDIGAVAGVMLDNSFLFGIYAQELETKIPRADLATIGYASYSHGEVKMKHGGMVAGYVHRPQQRIHWGITGSAGVGALYLYADNPDMQHTKQISRDRVFLIVPRCFVELNLTKRFKLNAGAGFRFVGKVNNTYINSNHQRISTFNKSDYSQPELSVSFLCGLFSPKGNK